MPTREIDSLTETVRQLRDELKRKNFTTRVAVGASIVVAALALVVGGIGIHEIHRTDNARCQAANEFRQADKARWDYIISLSPPPKSQGDLERLQKFEGYIVSADAVKKC